MNILDKIKIRKIQEVAHAKATTPLDKLADLEAYSQACNILSRRLEQTSAPAIIAEFKRQSPSKGIIRQDAHPETISFAYQQAGAAAISVLTDQTFFGALKDDFKKIRSSVQIPILRKEFIVDPYQVHETKSMGADIILLIAAMLDKQEVSEMAGLAASLGLDVLLEIHREEEIDFLCKGISLVGINNRDLKTFTVDTNKSLNLISKLPSKLPAVAESGLSDYQEIQKLYTGGFSAFLMGETFMRADHPGQKCGKLIQKLRNELK